MSLFTTLHAQCPACGAAQEIETVASVAGDRRPDLRDEILDSSFQTVMCRECGLGYRLPPRFTYLDFTRGLWLVAHPAEETARWAALETQTRQLFEAGYGAAAPPATRAIGRTLRPRLVFGWPAVREKLLCDGAGLDDVTVELVKAAVLRSVPGAPLADGTELRLDEAGADTLAFAWFLSSSDDRISRLTVPRRLCQDIEADAAWAPLRQDFAGAAFVDLGRLLS